MSRWTTVRVLGQLARYFVKNRHFYVSKRIESDDDLERWIGFAMASKHAEYIQCVREGVRYLMPLHDLGGISQKVFQKNITIVCMD